MVQEREERNEERSYVHSKKHSKNNSDPRNFILELNKAHKKS